MNSFLSQILWSQILRSYLLQYYCHFRNTAPYDCMKLSYYLIRKSFFMSGKQCQGMNMRTIGQPDRAPPADVTMYRNTPLRCYFRPKKKMNGRRLGLFKAKNKNMAESWYFDRKWKRSFGRSLSQTRFLHIDWYSTSQTFVLILPYCLYKRFFFKVCY